MTVQEQLESGMSHHKGGRLAEAERVCRSILAQQPEHAEALQLLGVLAAQAGKPNDAVELIGRAVRLMPNVADARYNLGKALMDVGRFEEAMDSFREAIRIKPDYAEAQSNLGIALRGAGRLEEAIASYRQAIRINPGFAEAYCNLGNSLRDAKQLDEAIAACRQAIVLKAGYAKAHNNLGNALKDNGQVDEAIASYREAIRLKPDYAEAHGNLAIAFMDTGRLDDAIGSYRQAVRLRPDSAAEHSNLVLTLHYHPGFDAKMIQEELRCWNRQHAEPLKKFIRPHGNSRDPDRRLRIGYLSPDFREHVVGQNLLPLIRNHDHKQFEIVCYASVGRADALTEEIRRYADVWRDIVKLSDSQAADLIRQDQIDILVDLTVHSANNRLLIFALKPAPVQVTYLGYCSSTGLEAMDYRLSDPHLDPLESDLSVYTERTIRLPATYWCYASRGPTPEPMPPPAETTGYITFGCLNNFSKVSPALELWAEMMRRVPRSRLIVHSPPGAHLDAVRSRFAGKGISPDRLEFPGVQAWPDYVRTYGRIDIALDPFPWGGGVTTCDALWMGVPVVSLAGRTAVGRGGASILSNIGVSELIARTRDEYIEIAVRLAGDLARLAEFRGTLRPRVQASPLIDAPRFARNLEAAYREMWRSWCAAPISIEQRMESAVTHHRAGRFTQAERIYHEILAQQPQHAEALHLLGILTAQMGNVAAAMDLIRQAIRARPDRAEAHNDLGNLLAGEGKLSEAIASYREVIRLRPNLAEPYDNLGIALQNQGHVEEAIEAHEKSMRLKPEYANPYRNLGNIFRNAGRPDEAVRFHRQAIRLRPDDAVGHGNLLFVLNYHPEIAPEAIAAEHRAWADRHARPLSDRRAGHANERSPDRRLRVGYVSADFCRHSVGYFFIPLLEHHDRRELEIFCYAGVKHPDDFTERIKRSCHAWRSISGLTDEAAVNLIQSDQIDILVDLSGHSAGNRLCVFARKPAPIQVTYLGYPNTTGMMAIDYRLTDAFADPEGMTDALNVEKLWRLPKCAWCFLSPVDAPEIEPRADRPITFGCFNAFAKINGKMVAIWAQLLKQVPSSRLLLKSSGAGRAEAQRRLIGEFAEMGIAGDRIEMHGWIGDPRGHLAFYGQVDVALDTFPYHGTTTTCEALWMGVPVVTLAGRAHISRVGVSLLTTVGLGELVAQTPEEYVSIASELANNESRLGGLRAGLRNRLKSSPLVDAAGFAAEVDAAYRKMWLNWCAKELKSG